MPEPTKIPRPFADSGDKNSIPDSSGSIGFASWQEGFPAITSEPFASGGVAPKRADFNGVFNALSAAIFWNQQGGVYAYDNTTDYDVGNVVAYNGDLYQCLVANGPSSSVKAPSDTSIWAILANAHNALLLNADQTLTSSKLINKLYDGWGVTNPNTTIRLWLFSQNNSLGLMMKNSVTSDQEWVFHCNSVGDFTISAVDRSNFSNRHSFTGGRDGSLTWDSVPVVVGDCAHVDLADSQFYNIMKLSNGFMIISGFYKLTTSNAYGALPWTYPESFIEAPSISVLSSYSQTSVFNSNGNAGTSNMQFVVKNYDGTSIPSGTTVPVYLIAVGRWSA